MVTLNASVKNFTKSSLKTHEGGTAKRITATQELRRTLMSCLLWESSFYEDGEDIADRLKRLIPLVKPENCVTMAIDARTKFNLRHAPLLIAVVMAGIDSHKPYVAGLLHNIIQRPDELSETLAIYWKDGKKPLSAQLKKGLSLAFTKFNAYSLQKYNMDKEIKLRDVMFLVHPTPKDFQQAEDWKRLTENYCEICWQKLDKHVCKPRKKHEPVVAKLPIADTWETAISATKGEGKREVWERLLREKKLGAMALLRNLRNMDAVAVDESLIFNSLNTVDTSKVFPYRLISAARAVPRLEDKIEPLFLNNLQSINKLSGKTVLLVDVSGSMDSGSSDRSNMTYLDRACAIAIMAREICENVEIYTFSNKEVLIPARHGFGLRDAIINSQSHSGTRLAESLTNINNKTSYDRIIVFTDEQTHDGIVNPQKDSKGYLINIASYQNGVGYGKWTHLDGFSEQVLRFIEEFEK